MGSAELDDVVESCDVDLGKREKERKKEERDVRYISWQMIRLTSIAFCTSFSPSADRIAEK